MVCQSGKDGRFGIYERSNFELHQRQPEKFSRMSRSPEEIKQQILRLTREYSALAHRNNRPGADAAGKFVPGETIVPYAGRVFNEDEVEAAVGSTLDFWLTLGPEGDAFEQELAKFLGVKKTILVNSG